MKVSIAMTTYNGEKYLPEQLNSFLSQEIQPHELIVCDDVSTDKTLKILNNFAKKANFIVKIYNNKRNIGYSKNFEKAILLCSGDIIFLSDQDDVWLKNKIKEVLNIIKSYPKKKIFMHDAFITDHKLKPIGQTRFEKLKNENKSLKDYNTGCLTIIKKEIVKILFPMPESEKHDVWINKYGYFSDTKMFIYNKLQYWRRHENNTSSTTASKQNNYLYLIKEIVKFFKHGNANPSNNLILKKTSLQQLKKYIQKTTNNILCQKTVDIACINLEKEIYSFDKRIRILKKNRNKRCFQVILFFLRGGYKKFNGHWTAIKDIFSSNTEIKDKFMNEGDKNKKSKHVTFILPNLACGGAEKMVINLANYFCKKNIRVDLILLQKKGEFLKNLSKDVKIINLNSNRALFSIYPLIKYLRSCKPDFLISTLNHINIVALISVFLSFKKTKIIIRSVNTFSINLKNLSKSKQIIQKFSALILYRFAHYVIANSKQSADDLAKILKLNRNKIKVIYNPTITPNIYKKIEEHVSHPWLNNEQITIIGVGRLEKVKNFTNLIKVIKILKDKIDIKLIILGEGSERKNLERLVTKLDLEDSVDLFGFTENPYSFVNKADIFVLSSNSEGLPNALIEAMACGTPVISTNCPSGPSEILDGGKFGKLVPVNNPEALAKAVIETLNNPVESSELKKRANFFSVENSANKYLHLMK